MFRAGLSTVIAQRAGTVWAAAVLALTADCSPLHPAVLLLHQIFTDVGKQREVETMGSRGGVGNIKPGIEKHFCPLPVLL